MKTNPLGTVANSRTGVQRRHMERTVGKGVCPLCKIDEKLNRVVRSGQFWMIWENPFPYQGHRHHIIIAHKGVPAKGKKHIGLFDLNTDEWTELFTMLRWAIRHFKIKGGAIISRFGPEKFNAGTLSHLHLHIQVPKPGKTAIAVFGKGPNWGKIARALAEESARPPA